ncbi:hypothetical protein WA158_005670 [Blastocystis sp. Blastoise]
MALRNVWKVMEKLAPLRFAEKWDNVGVLIDSFSDPRVSKEGKYHLLLCNDVNEQIVDEAIDFEAAAIISYHPIIFRGIKKVTPNDRISRIVVKCIQNNIAIYSPHTACDAAPGGVNDWIVEGLGPIVSSEPIDKNDEDPHYGCGRLVVLQEPYPSLDTMIQQLKTHFGIPHVQVASELPFSTPIKTVAVCAGSGNSVICGKKADLYVSGELEHHNILDAIANNTSVIVCNHSNSERGYLKELKNKLEQELGEQYAFKLSLIDKDPLSVY